MPFSISSLASCADFFGQIGVPPGVAADGVAGGGHLLEDFGMPHRVLADREEQSPWCNAPRARRAPPAYCAARGRRRRSARPRRVAGSRALEMLEAEARAAGGVDLDHAGDAERIGIARANGVGDRRRAGRGGGRRRCGGAGAAACAKPAEQRQAPAGDLGQRRNGTGWLGASTGCLISVMTGGGVAGPEAAATSMGADAGPKMALFCARTAPKTA